MNRLFLVLLLGSMIVSASCLQFSYAQSAPDKEFYSNGKVKSEINYSNGVREGEAKFYYENGNLKEERFYLNGRVEGLVRYYNEQGKLIEMANLENGKREGPVSTFDSTGTYLADVYFEAGKKVVETHPYYEQKPVVASSNENKTSVATTEKKAEIKPKPKPKVKKNKADDMLPPELVEEATREVDPGYYTEVEVMPEPSGGQDQIQKKVYYPTAAKENAIQGTVKIKTFIDEHGEVKLVEVLEGIGYGCDESASIAVYYTRFKPGLIKGKPVKVQMIVPVEFKL